MKLRSIVAPIRNVAPKIVLAWAAASSLGSSCGPTPPIETSQITIINHGVTWTSPRLGNNLTHGWGPTSLGPVADIGAVDRTRSFTFLEGKETREALFFDFGFDEYGPDCGAATCGAPPWPIPAGVNWTNIGPPDIHTTTERTVPMPVFATRLVDHGGCFTELPWLTTSTTKGVFDTLNDAF